MAIIVAGRTVSEPFKGIQDYLGRHWKTVQRYDLLAGKSPDEVTWDLIRATRLVSSRISNKDGEWFLEQSKHAPWSTIPGAADLCDADPLEEGGLYDQAEALWSYFWDERPSGVAEAMISKVLYLMRPGLFPILDSRLSRMYRAASRAASRKLAEERSRFAAPSHRYMYWAAIRQDLLASRQDLLAIKAELATSGDDVTRIGAQLTDLRLLDMLTWSL